MRRAYVVALFGACLIGCGSDASGEADPVDGVESPPAAGTGAVDAPFSGAPAPSAGAGSPAPPEAGAGSQAPPPAEPGPSGGAAAGDPSAPPADPGEPASPAAPARDYFPTEGWQTRPPEDLGLDPSALDAAFAYAQESNTQALLVVRGGYIAREAYYRGFGAEQRHESYSMAKSFTSGLVGIAIGAGLLPGVDVRVCEHYDAWDCSDDGDPRSRVTLAHAMTLTTGLEWSEDWSAGFGVPNDAISMSSSPRPIDYVLAKPSAHEPGTHFQYSTGDPALISGILESATGMNALAYARQVLFDTLGMTGVDWNSDSDGHTTTYAGLSATAREYAKYGFLYLNRGVWDGTQVVPSDWVAVSTGPGQGLQDWYGYLWHVNAPVKWDDPSLPADGFAAIGVQGQHIIVIPSSDLVIVRLADDGFGGSSFDAGVLIGHVLAAVE